MIHPVALRNTHAQCKTFSIHVHSLYFDSICIVIYLKLFVSDYTLIFVFFILCIITFLWRRQLTSFVRSYVFVCIYTVYETPRISCRRFLALRIDFARACMSLICLKRFILLNFVFVFWRVFWTIVYCIIWSVLACLFPIPLFVHSFVYCLTACLFLHVIKPRATCDIT